MRKSATAENAELKIRGGKVLTKGYGSIASSVMENEHITIGAKSLYAYLISKSGASSSCYPKNTTIMKALGIKSKLTLRDYKLELEVCGLLRIEERKYKSGQLTSNNYFPTQMVLDKMDE
jgi:hypothetical protein